ncbi:Homeotic protein labial [Frankliniella fusca]|uniref:Homeotic protein labial n=1 Tax=Frankliniella fusca TaxID=407009 RepID=A0AAE1GR31_9NEOP|nr:Homeotic protein labial [Frankliniella fusca]
MMTMNMYGCPPPDWGPAGLAPGACVGTGALGGSLAGPLAGHADRHDGYGDVPPHGYLGAAPAYYQYYPEYPQHQQQQQQHQGVGVITTDDGLSYTNLDYGPYGAPPGGTAAPAPGAAAAPVPSHQHHEVGGAQGPAGALKVEQPQPVFPPQDELYDPLGHVSHHNHHHHHHLHHHHNHHREDYGVPRTEGQQYLVQRPPVSPQFKEEYSSHQVGALSSPDAQQHPGGQHPGGQHPGGQPQGASSVPAQAQGVLGGEAPYSHLHLTPHHHHPHHHPHHHVHHQLQHQQPHQQGPLQQQQQQQQPQHHQQQQQQQQQQPSQQQAPPVPTYKWMQVKRNVPKPAGNVLDDCRGDIPNGVGPQEPPSIRSTKRKHHMRTTRTERRNHGAESPLLISAAGGSANGIVSFEELRACALCGQLRCQTYSPHPAPLRGPFIRQYTLSALAK